MSEINKPASPAVIARTTFNETVKALKVMVSTFEKNKFQAGMNLGKAILDLADVQTKAIAKKSDRVKKFNAVKVKLTKDASKSTGIGESTIREYVRFSIAENQVIIKKAKAKTVPACRLALKGTADPSKGGGDTTGSANVSTPTTATQTVNTDGDAVIGDDVITDKAVTLTADPTDDVENQAGALYTGIMNSIAKNPKSDQELIIADLIESLTSELRSMKLAI